MPPLRGTTIFLEGSFLAPFDVFVFAAGRVYNYFVGSWPPMVDCTRANSPGLVTIAPGALGSNGLDPMTPILVFASGHLCGCRQR